MQTESIDGVSRINAADLILGGALAAGRQGDAALLYRGSVVSFGELESLANRVSNALLPYLQTGDRVLMLLKDSPLFVASFIGIMRLGCVAVPLNTRLAARDVAFVMEDSSAAAIVLDEEFLPVFRAAAAGRSTVPSLVAVYGKTEPNGVSYVDLVSSASERARSRPMSADDMAFWLYSSGTTGTPKAAIHCHGDVLAGDGYMRTLGLGPGERVFASSKLFFAFALGHTILGGLRAGAAVVLYDAWPDAGAIADVVEQYRPTVMLSVPTLFRNLLREGDCERPGFRSVRTYLSAGEALPVSLYERWRETTGVPIIEGIGATETIFMFISGTPLEHQPGATGKPVPYADVRLLDSQDQPVTAANAAGTAWVRMSSLCRGYWRQPERTAAAFRDGWFRTGDTFSVDADGWWHYHGRSDDLLKISGQWVSPGEVEECAAQVPGVLEAAAVGVENADGLVRIALYLVPDESTTLGERQSELEAQVRHQLQSTLSIYKCPREIRFIDALPRTATGKVQRYVLRQLAARETEQSTRGVTS